MGLNTSSVCGSGAGTLQKELARLETLDLNNTQVTDAEIEERRTALPEFHVSRRRTRIDGFCAQQS